MKKSGIGCSLFVMFGLFCVSRIACAQIQPEGLRSRLELIDASNPAAPFKVRLQTANGQTSFRLGEKAVLELESDIDAYVIVLTRDAAGAIVQLWPNEWSPVANLKKGVPTLLPGGPDAGFKIEAQAPAGITLIKVIASRQQLAIDGAVGRGFPEITEGSKGFGLVGDSKKKLRRPSELAPEDWATAELLLMVTDKAGPVPNPLPPHSAPDRNRPLKPDSTANERHWQRWLQVGRDLRAGKLSAGGEPELTQDSLPAKDAKRQEAPTEIIVVRRDGSKGNADGYRREVVPITVSGAKGFDQGDLLSQIERILKEPGVITAYPNDKVDKQQTQAGVRLWNLHYHLANEFVPGVDIGWTKLPAEARRIRTPLIGVVDEGPDINDPRLAGIFATNPGEIPGNFIDDDNNGYIDDVIGWNFVRHSPTILGDVGEINHGSFVCSIIAGRPIGLVRDVQGIVPSAKIVPGVVFDGTNGGYMSDIIKALEYCTSRGAKVINLSLGSQLRSEFDLTLKANDPIWARLESAGIVLVCAAGNNASDNDTSPFFPAGLSRLFSNVISVMATDVGGDRGQHRDAGGKWSYFSNYGARSVTLAAPGTCIPGVPEPNKIGLYNGTSFAAPQVTAAVAMLMGMHPDWDYRKIIHVLIQTSTPLEALTGECVSGGIINLAAALDCKP